METIRGRTSLYIDFNGFKNQLKNYNRTVLDLGTGDGRFVHILAANHPDWFIAGVDACRENLREHSRAKLPNMFFAIACAQELPCEFEGLFSHITINFPWGSLLDGLLACDLGLMHGLASVSRPDAQIEIRLNSGALAETGTGLDAGARIIIGNLNQHGWNIKSPHPMDQDVLAKFPTSWAKRLAYGRDPRAMNLNGRRS
jgi:hypothetical protein